MTPRKIFSYSDDTFLGGPDIFKNLSSLFPESGQIFSWSTKDLLSIGLSVAGLLPQIHMHGCLYHLHIHRLDMQINTSGQLMQISAFFGSVFSKQSFTITLHLSLLMFDQPNHTKQNNSQTFFYNINTNHILKIYFKHLEANQKNKYKLTWHKSLLYK